jgi:quercetin dioxygenase-like cupin family protein
VLLSGRATLKLKTGDGERQAVLSEAGSYVVVPRNTWHTAKISEHTRMLFITPGEGTENRSEA